MEAEIFVTQLNEYISNGCNKNDELYNFIKGLILVTIKIKMIKKAQNPYIHVAKKWISAFQIIRCKIDISSEMLAYMNKFCSVVTIAFLRLAKSFHQYDPNYTQEFFCHWKEFLTTMKTSKRATSFIRYDVVLYCKCQTFIRNLKNAKNRCEQISILGVLTLYTGYVLPKKLSEVWQKVKRNNEIVFDDNLINNLIQLGAKPSLTDQHVFIKALNAMGTHIITFKATKMICENLDFHFTVPEDKIWLDFNLKDRSLMVTVMTKTTDTCRCFGIVTLPELNEYINSFDEYMLTIKGPWQILTAGTQNPISIVVNISLLLPIEVRKIIWKPNVRSFFKVLPNTNFIHARENVSVANRVKIKKRRFTAMILEPSNSYSSDDFEIQFKRPRKGESYILPKTKSWDNEFDRLKYSD